MTSNRELLDAQNVGENQHNKELNSNFEVQPIRKSPFACVRKDGEDWMLVLGSNIVTEQRFKSVGEAVRWLRENIWDVMMKSIIVVFNELEKYKKDGNGNEEKGTSEADN